MTDEPRDENGGAGRFGPFAFEVASRPGSADVPNEDAVVVTPHVVVVLDGVTPLDRERAAGVCRHGVAWYARTLGSELAGRAGSGVPLEACLAGAIEAVRDAHAGTCDLADVDAPAATVATVRLTDDALEYLVLADTVVALDLGEPRGGPATEPLVITDDRPSRVGRTLASKGIRLPAREFRARYANRDDGYWVAAADPSAARHALTGSVPIGRVRRGFVASDGATRLVEVFGRYAWGSALDLLEAEGARSWLARTRAAEQAAQAPGSGSRRPAKAYDDATIVLLGRTRPARRTVRPPRSASSSPGSRPARA